ncbi:MAG: entericidin A/B family lipoprotein [Inquilinus sp.]|uniref:entericidin A/B family lipoprotein n=1 Tax=Inquilinus sp. TaxID=1932117 RepID=UPI003F2EB501
MYQRATVLTITLLTLLGALPVLSGCHTTAGLGQDVSATGQAVSKTATKATPPAP